MKNNTLKTRNPNITPAYQHTVTGQLFKRRKDALKETGVTPKKVVVYQGTDGKTLSFNENEIAKVNLQLQRDRYVGLLIKALERAELDAVKVSKEYKYPMRSNVYNAIYKEHVEMFKRSHKRPANFVIPKHLKHLLK